MRIGISSGISNSPNSATFAEVVAALGYEYTWAYDASKQDQVATITGATTYGASIVAGGINLNFNATSTSPLGFQESDFTAGSVSSLGSETQIIPDGAMPSPGAHDGHPGRYLSIVVTLNTLTIADGSIGVSQTLFGFIISTQGAGSYLLLAGIGAGQDDASYVNGTARSGAFSQSEINGLIGSPITITWDLGEAFANANPNDDPAQITLYPSYGENVNMNATIHGFIFSATPPNITTLPVEISNPTVSGE